MEGAVDPPAAAMTLAVEGITVRRGGRLLLDGVSLRADRGEIVGVIGPNGAGKTTLFEAVAARVSSSTLFYLPDHIRPWADQRVAWALRFFAGLFDKSEDRDAIAALQLDSLLQQRVGSLSKGEAKRFAMALALSTPQPALLLDEPFDGLDFRQTRAAMDLLRARAAAGRTLVLSIHQLTDAARVCDRFLLLDHGRAIAEGELSALRTRVSQPQATLEEVFLALE
ncbi:MAG TPA: ABC transporter ATP-binding protein [Thermoanaerobaculia bacterium]|nr:ABC transporter ATP-binding protein [Thermoanaerobaculia bacterium]